MNISRKLFLTAGIAAVLFAAGYFFAHLQQAFPPKAGWFFYTAAVMASLFFVWQLLRGVIWKTEESLFVRSVKDFGPKADTQKGKTGDSPEKKSLPE